jgi:Voltage gated chloride channel
VVIAKMLTFAISQESGFVGGPIFPALFIGGTAGVLVHQVIPGVPLGLAFTFLLAAVPGGVVPAQFTMVLMAAFLTQAGALQTAPILIAVITAFLAVEGVKYLAASRKQANAAAAEQAGPPSEHSVESPMIKRQRWRSSPRLLPAMEKSRCPRTPRKRPSSRPGQATWTRHPATRSGMPRQVTVRNRCAQHGRARRQITLER